MRDIARVVCRGVREAPLNACEGFVARWLMTGGRKLRRHRSECDWSISVVRGDEVRRPEPKHLEPQVVVLVGLADPLHA
jgi:hypothetical protein